MEPKLSLLKLARLEKGLSQWHVSKETGISQSLVSLYKRDLVEPNRAHKEALASLYGRSMKELWQ